MFTAMGIAIGPLGFSLLKPSDWGVDVVRLLEEITRITVAIAVMGAALRLPSGYFRRNYKEMFWVLGPGMLLMWLATAVFAFVILPGPLLIAVLLGAILTPTDPVLADSIVTGRLAHQNVPARLRRTITAESGANDGLALFFVLLPLTLLEQNPSSALETWLVKGLIWEVSVGAAAGGAIGWIAGRALRRSVAQKITDKVSVLTISLALTFTVLFALRLLHSDAILGVFVAGVLFATHLDRSEHLEQEPIQEAFGHFFEMPVFVLFGMSLPWHEWWRIGPAAFVFAAAAILLRRLPAWLALRRALPSTRSLRDTLFTGWFGPIGIAALFYAAKATRETGASLLWPLASLVVFGSIVIHGFSAPVLTKLYGRAHHRKR